MAGIGAATIYVFSVSLSLLILGLYIVGTARYLTNVEDNTCDMTYMFEYPQYVRVALDEEVEERYPRFGLYAYGEGFVTQRLRRMKFSGIPVLFVPGNGGSHEQVRSLASVSLRKSIDDRTPFHFDYFTVSLGKDYSALYGGVLEDETSYVTLCISKISSLYGGKVERIVLIGHSMGGIIAKGALLRSDSQNREDGGKNGSSASSILVTMATPHKPIFLPDRTISRYYRELDEGHGLGETTLVSIGGGERDILVGSSQTIYSSADLNVITSGIPDVWKSTDHLCILWCKQFVLTVVRALFDCVDGNARPPTITSDARHKFNALSYHLTSRFAGKKFRRHDEREEFERGARWMEDIRRQYTWSSGNFRGSKEKSVFLMIRLDSISYDSITMESINLEAKDWIFACSAHAIEDNSRVCEWGWNLTNRTRLSPDPMHRSRKKMNLDIEDLRKSIRSKLSHVVVRIASSELEKKSIVKIHVDLYKKSDRTIRLNDSSKDRSALVNFLLDHPTSGILTRNLYGIVDSSPRGALVYRVDPTGVPDAVVIEIETVGKENEEEEEEKPLAIFELHHKSNNRYSGSQVRLITFKSGEGGRKQRTVMHLVGNEKSILTVSLGAGYSYRMIVRRAGIIERIACLVRDRWPTLYPITIGLCLIAVATRIDDSYKKTALTCGITLVLALTLDCVFETLVAIGLLHVFAVTTCCLVVFFGSVAHNVLARFFARIASLPNLWFDWLLGGLEHLPIIATFVVLSLISVTCGAIAILLSVALFFLKLTKMYDEYIEELLMASLRQFNPFARSRGKRKADDQRQQQPQPRRLESTSTKTRRALICDRLLIFVTWSLTAISGIPSALVWAKNFRYETRLSTEDPTMLSSWVILATWASLGFIDIPAPPMDAWSSRTLSMALRASGWILLYTARIENSAHYQWIVPPLVALCMTLVALSNLIPAGKNNSSTSERRE